MYRAMGESSDMMASSPSSTSSSVIEELFGIADVRDLSDAIDDDVEEEEKFQGAVITPPMPQQRYIPRKCNVSVKRKRIVDDRPYVKYDDLGKSTISYDEFLKGPQDICDDLKFVNDDFIEFKEQNLIIEQDRSLGKGGHFWDGAYILTEFMRTENKEYTRVLELGAGGNGFCSLAMTADSYVLTDGDASLLPLAMRNIQRNSSTPTKFSTAHLVWTSDNKEMKDDFWSPPHTTHMDAALTDFGKFDLIIAAECVAPLYNPYSLIDTIRRYCLPGKTEIRLAVKHARFPTHCEAFYDHMRLYFDHVEVISPINIDSRLRTADQYRIVKARAQCCSSSRSSLVSNDQKSLPDFSSLYSNDNN